MGSTDKAVITGFICRLCSKMNRFVIHIYGEEGARMQLPEKIRNYLPINLDPTDQLPKTACLECIEKLEAHHELMQQFLIARRKLHNERITTILSSSPTSTTTIDSTTTSSSPPPC